MPKFNEIKNIKDMKTYNYFYYGQAIQRERFLSSVPDDWKKDVDKLGKYTWGGYTAIKRD